MFDKFHVITKVESITKARLIIRQEIRDASAIRKSTSKSVKNRGTLALGCAHICGVDDKTGRIAKIPEKLVGLFQK